MSATTSRRDADTVPWRTIWAAIASVAVAAAAVVLVVQIHRILTWLLIAVFLTVVLNPLVDRLTARLHGRRPIAAALVVIGALALTIGIAVLFARPLVSQASGLVDDAPKLVEDARAGRGPIGDLVERFQLEQRLTEQQDQLRGLVGQLGSQSLRVLGAIGSFVAGTVSVIVLTLLMLIDGGRWLEVVERVIPARHRPRVRRVGRECARAVNGYMTGNLLISVIAGASTFVMLLIMGVPFAGVLALFVAIMDLVPLVGATIGAVVVVVVALIHAPVAGIVAIVFFVVYQQVENHLLQPVIQGRAVHLSALAVLVSALIGVEVAGILGALLAVPSAAVIKVVGAELWSLRHPGHEEGLDADDALDLRTEPPRASGARDGPEAVADDADGLVLP